jgi:hypothetical protein
LSGYSGHQDISVAVFVSGVIKLEPVNSVDIVEREGTNLENYKLIIVTTGAFTEQTERNVRNIREESIRRHRELHTALRRGSHVCLLLNDISDYLIMNILSDIKCELCVSTPSPTLKTKKPEFQPFLDKYGTSFADFKCTKPLIPIATTERNDTECTVAFSKIESPGLLTFLPFFITESQLLQTQDIEALINSLNQHKNNVLSEPPLWIDSVRLQREKVIVGEISELRNKLKEKCLELGYFNERKKILWSKGNELRDQCMSVLQDMGLLTLLDEIGEEDFWILNQKEKSVIVEVKGKDHGIKRGDLYALDTHREERKKGDDFPALLLINTFNRAQELEEKDAPIPSDEIRRAIGLNLLIMRTYDLLTLLDLHQKGEVDSALITRTLEKEHGWLKVTQSGFEIVSG